MRAWILLFTIAVLLDVVAEGYSRKRWDDKGIHKRYIYHRHKYHPRGGLVPRNEDEEVEGIRKKGLLGRTNDKKGHRNGLRGLKKRKKKHHLFSPAQQLKMKLAGAVVKQTFKKKN